MAAALVAVLMGAGAAPASSVSVSTHRHLATGSGSTPAGGHTSLLQLALQVGTGATPAAAASAAAWAPRAPGGTPAAANLLAQASAPLGGGGGLTGRPVHARPLEGLVGMRPGGDTGASAAGSDGPEPRAAAGRGAGAGRAGAGALADTPVKAPDETPVEVDRRCVERAGGDARVVLAGELRAPPPGNTVQRAHGLPSLQGALPGLRSRVAMRDACHY